MLSRPRCQPKPQGPGSARALSGSLANHPQKATWDDCYFNWRRVCEGWKRDASLKDVPETVFFFFFFQWTFSVGDRDRKIERGAGQAKKGQDIRGLSLPATYIQHRPERRKKEARETKKDIHPNAPMGTETRRQGRQGIQACACACTFAASRQRPHAPVNWVASERSNTLPIASLWACAACLVWLVRMRPVPCSAIFFSLLASRFWGGTADGLRV